MVKNNKKNEPNETIESEHHRIQHFEHPTQRFHHQIITIFLEKYKTYYKYWLIPDQKYVRKKTNMPSKNENIQQRYIKTLNIFKQIVRNILHDKIFIDRFKYWIRNLDKLEYYLKMKNVDTFGHNMFSLDAKLSLLQRKTAV